MYQQGSQLKLSFIGLVQAPMFERFIEMAGQFGIWTAGVLWCGPFWERHWTEAGVKAF